MKIHASNWDQKQFTDMASAPSANNREGWQKVAEKNPTKTYQINSHSYKVVAKMERHHVSLSGIALGLLCAIGTLGLAPLFSKNVRQLFTGRQVLRVVEEVFPNIAEKAPPLAPIQAQGVIAPQMPVANSTQFQKATVYDPTAQSRAQIYQNAPTYPTMHPLFQTMSDPGGAGNVVNKIMQTNPNAKCGVMICANSGLPCGQVGADGYSDLHTLNAKTQEESIIANVLMTQFGNDKAKHKQFMDASFKGVWGMVDGPVGTSTKTHQGIDFRHATDASVYNQAYAVNKCQLGVTQGSGANKTLVPGQQNEVSLIFADSINANPKNGTAKGTMQRTMNEKASNDYDFFRECVKTKLRSSLDAMVAEGNTHAIVGRLSCGIYAPDKFKLDPTNINKDFDNILAEVLNEQVGPNGEARRSYFQQVVIPHISK